MCGISGVLLASASGARQSTLLKSSDRSLHQILEPMVRQLKHRGPDDQGISTTWSGEAAVGLGHSRLAILELSEAGHQPMHDPFTGNIITYNGEIYNYRELRHNLDDRAQGWRSQSDTEVILRAYSRWGKDCVDHFRGMFAFAIWDEQRQRLLLARDRLGIKPLYYYSGKGFFLFASEVRALLASGLVPRELDPIGFSEYLAYQSMPAPRTMILGVQALPPGTWMEVDASGQTSLHQYWDLLEDGDFEACEVSLPEGQKRVEQLLQDSVSLHLVS